MRRYDAVMGCCVAFLLMATAVISFLYFVWWAYAAGSMPLMALPGVLLVLLWALFLWVARRSRAPSDATTQ